MGSPLRINEASLITEDKVKKKKKKESPFVKAFKQCGGQAWTGKQCCAKGCACVPESKYFSSCHPTAGAPDCDYDKVSGEVSVAHNRLAGARKDEEAAVAKVRQVEEALLT